MFGLSRETVLKMCRFSLPPGYTRTKPAEKPKLGPHVVVIDAILEADRTAPLKQRHTAKRIFERLRAEHGFDGGYTVVKDHVRVSRARGRETFVPLAHPPGHAQVDFGEAIAVIGGVRQKIHFFCLDLPQSDACFVKAYPRETTEAFLDGHVSGFGFFGGVPLSVLYDNTKIAVAKICGDGKRERTRAFTELVSHCLFQDRFGRPGKGNDKGKVEGLVKYARANFMTPLPTAASFEDPARRHRLRRGQADHPGAHRTTACASRSGGLPASAAARGEDDGGRRLHGPRAGDGGVSAAADGAMPAGTRASTPQVLLGHHLKQLKLPTILREYDKVARECAQGGIDHPGYLLRLLELELIDRERRVVERRIRAARFPAVKSLDTFDFTAIPSLNKMLVLDLARCEYVLRRENIIALGNSGTGKSHIALALGLAACQKGFPVAFTTAAALVTQLMEARDERRLLKMQRELQAVKLLIVDELGYVPLSPTGAELLFETVSQRYERGSTIITSNLPFEDWTSVLGSERLTGALLDRLTHHVTILAMNGDSYRLKQSKGRRRTTIRAEQNQATGETLDPDTGEITID